MATQIICNYNKLGHCKYGETCRNQHVNEICEKTLCDVQTCNLRHPRVCRWFRDFQRCKFIEYCSYSHVKKVDDFEKLKKENESFEKKISEIEKKMVEKDKLLDSIVISMLEKFRKLEEKVFKFEIEESENDLTFYNPAVADTLHRM